VSLIGALCYAELASAYPHAGGDYYYFQRAFGDWMGFLFAWARLAVIQTGSIALLAFVFGDYASELWSLGPHSSSIYAAVAIATRGVPALSATREGVRKILAPTTTPTVRATTSSTERVSGRDVFVESVMRRQGQEEQDGQRAASTACYPSGCCPVWSLRGAPRNLRTTGGGSERAVVVESSGEALRHRLDGRGKKWEGDPRVLIPDKTRATRARARAHLRLNGPLGLRARCCYEKR